MNLIGIDLGNSNSYCAIQIDDRLEPLMDPNDQYGLPSVFFHRTDKSGRVIEFIGREAERRGKDRPDGMIRSVKRMLADPKTADQEIILSGDRFTPVEIIEQFVARIRRDADDQLAKKGLTSAEGAVVGVPIKFGDNQRNAIRCAAERAGFQTVRLITEPVAAALEVFRDEDLSGEQIVIFDLGGGTLDVALVASDPNGEFPYRVLDTSGLILGGDDWDEALMQCAVQTFLSEYADFGAALNLNDSKLRKTLLDMARDAKESLTNDDTAWINIGGCSRMKGFSADEHIWDEDDEVGVEITRSVFEATTRQLLNQALDCTETLLRANNIAAGDRFHICLVGGSSNMPQIQNGIAERFPAAQIRIHEPSRAIAFGAARYCNGTKIENISDFTFAVATHHKGEERESLCIMIRKGDRLPSSRLEHFSTLHENQTEAFFPVYEIDDFYDFYTYPDITVGRKIMDVTLGFGKQVPKGTPANAALELTDEGVLTIRAINPDTNEEKINYINIKRSCATSSL